MARHIAHRQLAVSERHLHQGLRRTEGKIRGDFPADRHPLEMWAQHPHGLHQTLGGIAASHLMIIRK
jgi:hypothetical protein